MSSVLFLDDMVDSESLSFGHFALDFSGQRQALLVFRTLCYSNLKKTKFHIGDLESG